MGMDLIEIVVEVEERFRLKMTSSDWQSLGQKATVQDLADWVWEHLPPERRATDEAGISPAVSEYKSLERATLAWLQKELQQILGVAGRPAEAFPADLSLTQLPGRPRMRLAALSFAAKRIAGHVRTGADSLSC